MSLSAAAEVVDETTPEPVTRRLATRGQISQVLSFNCTNGKRATARAKFNTMRGVKPDWNDPHAKHRDRELFWIEDVAWELFPNDAECRENFLSVNFANYARQVDKTAIQHYPAIAAA